MHKVKKKNIKGNKKIVSGNSIIYFMLIVGGIIMLFPFIWMILTSFKTLAESIKMPPDFFPASFENIAAYVQAFKSMNFAKLYLNTGLMILLRVLCAVVFSSMAGYAFAKLKIPFKNVLFAIVLAQMMLPGQIFLIPQYEMITKLNATDTIFALVFPGLVSAFGTFFLRQFYMSIPDDLLEAARLDGCTQFQTFYKIALPLTKSAVAALAVFTALFAYGDLMWPLIVNTSKDMLTLSSGLSCLKGQFLTNYPVLMAGAVMAMWPMLLIYLFCQKQFIEGIALTGTKA